MLGWDWSRCSDEDAIRDSSEVTFCSDHLEAYACGFCPRCHAGLCPVCSEPVAKGREELHDGDVFHRYLDASGRCAP